jgi:transcription antitermination factor NusG
VKSRQERVVAASLEGKGYEQLLPLYRSSRRWADRVKTLDTPLFPGYVFARFEFEKRLPVLMIPAVVHVVGIGNVPAPIAAEEIAAIQTIVNSGLPAAPWPFLRAGQRVRMERGPLQGMEGLLVHAKKRDRIIVSVSLLQRSVAVEIDRDSIWPISQ